MHISLTYESIIRYIQTGVDILACWIILNYLIKVVRTNQKTIQLFQGVIFIILIQALSKLLGLTTVEWLANNIVSWGFLAVVVIFQPEIRSILERLGKSNAFARISTLTATEKEKLIDELMAAIANLAASKTGALITLEQAYSLNDYINTGVKLNSIVTAELLCSIFQTTTPLHDGAIIIQGDKIACASAYFPPTTMDLPAKYGARHRAGIGISEITDSVTIIVSEETGRVSVAEGGKLLQMNEKKLREYLNKVILNKESVKGESFKSVSNASASVEALLKKVASENTDTENELNKHSNTKEMKVFQTASFSVSDLEQAEEEYELKTNKLVESIVSQAVSDNTIDETIAVRTVATAKDLITESSNKPTTIKTTSVTTGTEKIFTVKDDNQQEEDDE